MSRFVSLSSALLFPVTLVVLLGFSVPLEAQGPVPVELVCVQNAHVFQPICNQTRQAINASPQFRQAMSGNRYAVILFAQTCDPVDRTGGRICNTGDALVSITYAAIRSDRDPLSEIFPYTIACLPWVFASSEAPILGGAIIEALPVAVDAFSEVLGENKSFGTSARTRQSFDEGDIAEEIKSAMHEFIERRP